MISLLILVTSYLFSVTESQCNNTHNQSLLFSISINGNQIDKIGLSRYLSIVEFAAKAITPSAITKVGINTFGGVIGETMTTKTKLSMQSTNWSIVQSTIHNLSSENFDANWGNSVSGAIKTALSSSWFGQKYHILFSSGIPLANGYGSTTNPINFDDPCTGSISAKQKNIQQYVVLIGLQGTHYIKEYFSCMVEDPDHDIIEINPLSIASGIAKLQSRVCKTSGIDIKITEINPVDTTYRPFIEVLNRGSPASISVCWSINACSIPATVATGAYYIGYSQGNGAIPTLGTVRGSLGVNVNSSTEWIAAHAKVNDTVITSITHASDIYWQSLLAGSSYELRAIGYNNMYGANWRMSCYPNEGGTPGYSAVDCQELDNSCNETNCDINGAISTGCGGVSSTASLCECPTTYLEDIRTCIKIPQVNGGCVVYVIHDDKTQTDFTYFTWNKVEFDDSVSYDLLYPSVYGISYWSAGGVAAASRNDAHSDIISGEMSPNISIIAKYRSQIRNTLVSSNTEITCSVQTSAPVINPTVSPTLLPTVTPTILPTFSPTDYESGVFISNICSPARCGCFGRTLSCCQPFGPWEDTHTLTSGFVPPSGCNHLFQTVEIEPYHLKRGLNESIMVQKMSKSGYIEVRYTIYDYGIIDQNVFQNLSAWNNYYVSANNNESHRLQNVSTSTLNIEVKPPGNSGKHSGIIVISDGDQYGELPLNILISELKCTQGDCPVTYNECRNQGMALQLVIDSCTATKSTECDALYPSVLWLMVYRSHQLCVIATKYPVDDKIPSWIWWGLLALLLFMVCLTILVYRFWLQHRDLDDAVASTENDLVEQQNANDAGFYQDLNAGDIVFNVMATAVPGSNVPSDPFGNELHQRQQQQQNEMAQVDTHTFVVRQSYAPISTKPRKDEN